MPGRKFNSGDYRFGFNGKENDSEWGSQVIQDYGFRIYNPSIGKFLSVDPLSPDYPWYTPYQFAGNTPIRAIDLDGLEEDIVIDAYNFTKELVLQNIDDGKVLLKSMGNYTSVYWNALKKTPGYIAKTVRGEDISPSGASYHDYHSGKTVGVSTPASMDASKTTGQSFAKSIATNAGGGILGPVAGVTVKLVKGKIVKEVGEELGETLGAKVTSGTVTSSLDGSIFKSTEVLGRRVYKNSRDVTPGVPSLINDSVHKSVREKVGAGWSNKDLMKAGYAPIGPDGNQINLHHLIGKEPGGMIELTKTFHSSNHKALHGLIEKGTSFRNNPKLEYQYTKFRKNYWKERAKDF